MTVSAPAAATEVEAPSEITSAVSVAAIGVLAFLTVVDLFATQAILPSLAKAYGVNPSVAGAAVNASTLGMSGASLAVARLGGSLDRRRGVSCALGLLAIPTLLLAFAPNLVVFAMLRLSQGILMAAAFALTLSHFAETTRGRMTTTAIAAYVTGNVASNLFGRLMSASIADVFGLQSNFIVFALLNLVGGLLAYVMLSADSERKCLSARPDRTSLLSVLGMQGIAAAAVIGFCILFVFIGIFTYVNFVLVRPPLSLGMMSVGLVYFVFLPAIVTTPLSGKLAARLGVRRTLQTGLGIAAAGMPLLLAPSLWIVLSGLAAVGVGTFLAQATTAAFVGRAAASDAAAASGLYLAGYYLGGLAGTLVLGQVFVSFGWGACLAGAATALAIAAFQAQRLQLSAA